MEMVRKTIRLPQDLLDFLEGQVTMKRARGLRADLSDELRICVHQRMISKLSKTQRAKLYKRLGIKNDPDPAKIYE